MIRIVGAMLIFSSGLPSITVAQSVELVDDTDAKTTAKLGKSTIAVPSLRIKRGESLKIDVKYEGYPFSVFNPFFNSLIPRPAMLALFDAERTFLGDLLRKDFGSRRSPGPDDWVSMAGGVSYVGTTLEVATPRPGTYYLQLIYYKRFTATRPDFKDGEMVPEQKAEWILENGGFSGLRSNVIEIEIVE